MRKFIVIPFALSALTGCDTPANVASRNIALAAENFEVSRRIVFFNGITDSYLLSIEGLCSIDVQGAQNQLEVTCKTGPDEFKKHHLGLADNVAYFSEQIQSVKADSYHYRVVFRPQTVVPSISMDVK